MKTYKAPDNSLHAIEPEFAHMLPAGCVEITEEDAEVLRLQIIAANSPSIESLKQTSIEKVKELRRVVFAALAGLQSESLAVGDIDAAAAIVPVQAALRNLPAIDLSACQTQADIDAAFLNAWTSIVAITPLNVVSAFNGVL